MNAFNINVYIVLPLVFVLAYFIWRFLHEYLYPGKKLARELGSLAHRIRSIQGDASLTDASVLARELLEKAILESPIKSSLQHLWSEYSETLHPVRGGEGEIVNVRATISSGDFFTKYSVIDLEIRADFYKHLPGILTGVGIIATFVGLIVGLGHYDTQDPDTLELLIREVFSAFVGSCTAIVAAICITFFEKKYYVIVTRI